MVLQGFLDASAGGGADALVDRECLQQVRDGVAGVALPEVGVADSFQSACLLIERANVTGDLDAPPVIAADFLAGRGARG
jgi:hypothetical protein